jgi:hypothetical protein
MAKKSVFCIAGSVLQADKIVTALKQAGFTGNDISAIFPDRRGTRDLAHKKRTKAPEGAATGAGCGAVLGGALGWLVGLGTLAIPGVGPLVAAGPLLAGLSGAAVGGAVGGFAGTLIGLGIPEYEAKRFAGKLAAGNILLSVHASTSHGVRRVKEIFKDNGAQDIAVAGESAVAHRKDEEVVSATAV